MRILVVEDEARLAQTLAELLHRQGYTADISGDGLSGLDNAASDIYDLVVLDAMLPGMDGFTLLQRLRQEGHTVPVLMLTARSGVEDKVRGLDSGADYYLTKPFEPQELLACVRLLLRRTDGQPRQEDAVSCGDLRLAIAFLKDKLGDVLPLVEAAYPFEAFAEAWEHAARPGAMKVIVDMDMEKSASGGQRG